MRLLFTGDTAGNPEVDVSFYTTDEVMTSATRTPVTLAAGCRRTVLTKEDIQRSPRIRANEADTQPVADLFVVEAAL